MSFKPTDFFVGLADFFSILLPGFCVVFLFGYKFKFPDGLIDEEHPWVFYAISSYIAGHVVYALSTTLKGRVYGWIIKHFFKENGWLRKKNVINKAQAKGLSLIEEADLIKNKKFADSKLSSYISTYDWIKIKISEKSPDILSNIIRLESDSKFFRSLTIVSFLFFLITIQEVILKIIKVEDYDSIIKLVAYAVCVLALFLFSLWRYANRRFNAEELASLSIINLYNDK